MTRYRVACIDGRYKVRASAHGVAFERAARIADYLNTRDMRSALGAIRRITDSLS